ncbi:MAG: GNAT family N-acetyltransferase [Clostridia bacterium]|nr:GNAT family N-acetyltransferase [Clostridia bacterium]
MDIEIRKLTPELTDDYIHFFDITPHSERPDDDECKCYCVWWCSDDYEGKEFITTSLEKRRDYAIQCIKTNNIQGYLAYSDDKVVGWCNANTKSKCLKCFCWRRFMGSVPTEESSSGIKVKSVFCFTIALEMRRKGVSKLLLERVCQDAVKDGFDFVEAYPRKESFNEAKDCMGPAEMFRKSGFIVYAETADNLVMRKMLK